MKIAIVIKSCQRDREAGFHQAIRETWAKNIPNGVDVLFIVGGETYQDGLLNDEIYFPVDDGYWDLQPKVKLACKYIVDNNYDFVYFCDTDSYLIVDKLLQSGFEKYDFSGGHLCGRNKTENQFGVKYSPYNDNGAMLPYFYVYLSGGVGFFLSNRAAKALAETDMYFRSEDVWSGQTLGSFIERGEMTAAVLPFVEHHSAWHLNCGYYGGGHKERLNAGEAVRRKHKELGF